MKILAILLILLSSTASAQWQQTNGPFGSSITCLTRIPTGILAGSANGIYFSNDEGATWSDYPFFQNCWITTIISDSNEIMIMYKTNFLSGNYNDSTYFIKSFDLGQTWSIPFGIMQPDYNALHLYKMQGLLFTYSDKEIFKSSDKGNTWTSTTIPNGRDILRIYFFDKYGIVQQDSIGTPYIGNTYFCDSAFNFYPVGYPLRNISLLMLDSVSFGYKNIGNNDWEIIKSSDLGQTSTVIHTVSNSSFSLFINNDSLYYRGFGGQIYVSSDYGVTFNTTYYPHFLNYNYALPLINGEELSVWQGTGTLVHYIPSIDSSYDSFQGMRGLNCRLYSDGTTLICTRPFGAYLSIDDGNTWQEFEIPCSPFSENTLLNGDTIFNPGFGTTDCKSLDAGITWTSASRNGLPNTSINKTYLKNGNLFFSRGDIYKSSDLGDNWNMIPRTPFVTSCGQNFPSNGPICSHNNNIFCVTTNGSIFKLDSNDSTWTYLYCFPYDIWNSGSTSIISSGNKLIASVDSSFFISDDEGQNWYVPRMDGLPRGYDYLSGNANAKIMPTSLQSVGSDLLGVCGNYGIYLSSNNGDDWEPFPTNTCPFSPSTIAICNNKLFSGSSSKSVWMNSISLGIIKSDEITSAISIFPNPSTYFFSISVPNSNEKINLDIFDQYGKLISHLGNVKNNENISIINLLSGIYFVIATNQSGNFIDSKKLVVVK